VKYFGTNEGSRERTRKWARLAWVVCLAVAAMAFTACGSSDESSGGSGDAGEASGGDKAESGEYVVGYVSALTGWLAPFEEPFRQALELRVEQINADGGVDGHKIKMIIKDGKSDPARGAEVAREMLDEGAQFLINPCDQDVGIPAGQVGQQKQIPTLSACAGAATFPEAVGDYQFLNTAGTFAEGSALAEWALKQDAKTAFLMNSKDIAYIDTLASTVKAHYEQNGGKIVGSANYKYGAPTFKAQMTQIANTKPAPEIVFLLMNIPDSVVALRELAAQGFKGQVILSYASDSPVLFQAGKALEQIKAYVLAFGFAEKGSRMETFYASYEKKYGKAPESIFAGLGGDAVDLIKAAVEAAGSTDPKAVRDAFDNLENVEVTTGTRTYKGANRVPRTQFAIETPNGETFELVEYFSPEKLFQP
jgi:branched-chain amino acid transport system substrate-binding protein